MNKGISLAKGEWLYFMGADDRLYNANVLFAVEKEFSKSVAVVSGKIQYRIDNETPKHLLKNNGVFRARWSRKLWIKNTVHHQATFYRKELLAKEQFNLRYNVLADYAMNLALFKQKVPVKELDLFIASCGIYGRSKKYNWSLYKEEIHLKTQASSILCWPLFFKLAILKYLLK